MLFCPAEKCAFCFLLRGSAECLRKQARRCLLIAKNVRRLAVRETLNDLSSELTEQAIAIERAGRSPPL